MHNMFRCLKKLLWVKKIINISLIYLVYIFHVSCLLIVRTWSFIFHIFSPSLRTLFKVVRCVKCKVWLIPRGPAGAFFEEGLWQMNIYIFPNFLAQRKTKGQKWQHGHNFFKRPQIKKLRALSFLQLWKFKKAVWPYFFDMRPI